MDQLITIGFNTVAVIILVFGLYFPRHRDRDMVVAYLGINVGVLVVASVLSSVDVSLGVGIGLFGVLSIIRLRSEQLSQRQVAYYFAALSLGLLGGTKIANVWHTGLLMVVLLFVLWIGDSSFLLGSYRTQAMTIDHAFLNEHDVAAYLEPMLEGEVRRVTILKTDLVNDTTQITVVYTTPTTVSVGNAQHVRSSHRMKLQGGQA